jgi:large subunit ribosomal protein L10
MLTREQKQRQIDSLKEQLGGAEGLFVMSFTGLKVGEVTELRRKIREANGNYVVVKNRLARIAVAGTEKEPLQTLLGGMTAVAYTSVDPVALAKALADFAKGHEKLTFRGGVVEHVVLDAAQARQVAALPSKPELVARLLFLLQSPMRRLVTALNWPVQGLASTVSQIAKEKESQA